MPLFQAKFDKSPRRIAKLQEIPNVSLDATTAGAKTKPAAVGESRNKYSWAGIVLVRVELPVRSATGVTYSLTQFGHLLIILAEFGGSVFLGALGGAVIAGPTRHVGWKSALLAGVACFICALIVGFWYEGHLFPGAQYAPGSHASTWFLWSAAHAIVFAFAITRLRGATDNE